jgi:hypothetical protein
MAFRVIVSPVVRFDGDRWENNIYIERAVGVKELFATAFGDSKHIATMRAELVALAINRGTGNFQND